MSNVSQGFLVSGLAIASLSVVLRFITSYPLKPLMCVYSAGFGFAVSLFSLLF